TLLNILSSKSILDSGEFWLSPDLRIGILDQKITKKGNYNLKKYLILEGEKKNFSEFKIERVIKEIKLDKNKVVD